MNPISDSSLARRVVERGLISSARLQDALAKQANCSEPLPLSRILLDGGYLSSAELASVLPTLEDAPTQTRPGVGRATPSPGADTKAYTDPGQPPPLPSPGAASPAPLDAPNFGRYRLEEEVGRGGMGVVYRAFDTQLRREVAIKTLREGEQVEPELLARLVREAQIVAALDHPGIVPVHDVGRVGNVAFYAMAFVRGLTLDRHLEQHPALGWRERAVLVQRAAEAVAHAHDRRVIHRDLKPGNLIVDPAGAVHVMDFGLAKTLDGASRLTASGEVLGTASYMPPEQIEGDNDRVGPAADVYSLGAVIYEALTGRPPFQGRSFAEIAVRVTQRDPRAPRKWNRLVPVDLETICLKALQKVPADRYPSARELAEDLGRFAAGEAIRARPETAWEKSTRWAARRPWLCALMAATLLTGGLAGFMTWRAAEVREDRTRLAAEKLEALRKGAALAVDGALAVRRAGGAASVLAAKFGAALEDLVGKALEADASCAEPHYYRARFYRILNRDNEALAELDAALAVEPGFAPAWYERAVLSMDHYFLALARSDRRHGRQPDPDVAAWQAKAQESLDRLAATLARDDSWTRNPVGLLRLGAALTAAEGMRKVLRDQDARADLLAALREDPELEEPRVWLVGDSRARGRLAEALELADAGLQVDRGNVRLRLERAYVLIDLAVAAGRTGSTDVSRHLRGTVDECGAILALDPRSIQALRARAVAWRDLGVTAVQSGADETESVASAIRDCEAALAIDPAFRDALFVRGASQLISAKARFNRQQDPAIPLAAAQASFEKLLRADPTCATGWRALAEVEHTRGLALGETGADPSPAFRSAVAAADHAIALNPADDEAWAMRATSRLSLARRSSTRGEDAEPELRAAIEDLESAVRLDPGNPAHWVTLGDAAFKLADHLALRGAEPTEVLQRGIQALDRALEIHPDDHVALQNRSACWQLVASRAASLGRDADAAIQRALRDADRGVTVAPDDGDAWAQRGTVREWMLDRLREAGRELPEDLYHGAVADLEEAIRRSPRHAYFHGELANLRTTWCRYRWDQGGDPGAEYSRSLAGFDAAQQLDPTDPQYPSCRGNLRTNWMLAQRKLGPIPVEEFARTFADLDLALRIAPAHASSCYLRAVTWMIWSGQEQVAGRNNLGLALCGVLDLQSAIRLNPQEAKWPRELAEWTRLVESAAPALLNRGQGSSEWWRRPIQLADGELSAGRAGSGRLLYAEGLRRAAEAGVGPDPIVRNGHYNLACLLVRGSGGTPADRDDAFAHLDRALDLGWRDADHLEADPDLASLRTDARWPGLVRRARQ